MTRERIRFELTYEGNSPEAFKADILKIPGVTNIRRTDLPKSLLPSFQLVDAISSNDKQGDRLSAGTVHFARLVIAGLDDDVEMSTVIGDLQTGETKIPSIIWASWLKYAKKRDRIAIRRVIESAVRNLPEIETKADMQKAIFGNKLGAVFYDGGYNEAIIKLMFASEN